MNSGADITTWKDKPDWFDKIPIEEYEKLAAIGYTPKQIAMFYRIKYEEFMWYYNLIASPLKYHYERGQLVQQAKEGMSMVDAAQTGENVTQAQRLDKLRKEVEFKNTLNEVFFGDIG